MISRCAGYVDGSRQIPTAEVAQSGSVALQLWQRRRLQRDAANTNLDFQLFIDGGRVFYNFKRSGFTILNELAHLPP